MTTSLAVRAIHPNLVLRPCKVDPEDGAFTVFDGGRKHWILRSDDEKFHMRCRYSATNKLITKRRESIACPPVHIHRHQTEVFEVVRPLLSLCSGQLI